MKGSRTKQHWLFLLVTAILSTASVIYVYMTKLHYPPIRSDGLGYYLYLPAVFCDHDITLKKTAVRSFGGEIPTWTGTLWFPDLDAYVDKYPIGEALMLSPFFLIGHAVAAVSGSETNGFSTPYQYAAAFAGVFYFLAGLYYLQKMLTQAFATATVSLTLLCMTFGTNLFHYGTLDSLAVHSFCFFLFACFLDRVERWHSSPRIGTTLSLALISGLITLARPSDSLIFIYFFLYGVRNWTFLKERVISFAQRAKLLSLGLVAYAVVLLPQALYVYRVTGRWTVFSYSAAQFNFLHPEVPNVLFSVQKGLFFWSPLLLIATVGFIFLRRYKPALVLPTLLFMPLNLYIIASWMDWTYGGSFGQRPFTESIPIFAFGYASLVESIAVRAVRWTVTALSSVLTVLSIMEMHKYWFGIIPFNGVTWTLFVDTLFKFTP
jgi:hypothetical protein